MSRRAASNYPQIGVGGAPPSYAETEECVNSVAPKQQT